MTLTQRDLLWFFLDRHKAFCLISHQIALFVGWTIVSWFWTSPTILSVVEKEVGRTICNLFPFEGFCVTDAWTMLNMNVASTNDLKRWETNL